MVTHQLDTNFILEYLLKNHPERAVPLKEFLKRVKEGKEGAILNEPVFLETAVVLSNFYKLSREKISQLLERILAQTWLDIENKTWITLAVRFYADYTLDMTDCLLLARARIQKHTIFTFDAKLNDVVESLPSEEK